MSYHRSRTLLNVIVILAVLLQGFNGWVYAQDETPGAGGSTLPPVNGPFPSTSQALNDGSAAGGRETGQDPGAEDSASSIAAVPVSMTIGEELILEPVEKTGSSVTPEDGLLIPDPAVPSTVVEPEKESITLEPSDNQATGWVTIMSETFEGAFPSGLWRTFDNDGPTNGEYYWDDDDYKPYAGSWSAWAANGGANGLDPMYYYYPNNARSWMVYGPFSLADATDAELLFYFWNQSEAGYDYFTWAASTNGVNFYGYRVSGNYGYWSYRNFDLTAVPTLGNLAGQPAVWIAFTFYSDSSVVGIGPFVDNIVLQKYVAVAPDLVPFQPTGWDDRIVASMKTGTHTIETLNVGRPAYIDWAVINNGGATANTFTSCLYFDGAQINCWATNGLNQNYYAYVEDWLLNVSPTAGYHTLEIRADVNNTVIESNESNNTWSRQFYWVNVNPCGPFTSSLSLDIPDDGSWLSWNLLLPEAPDGARVEELRVKLALEHPAPQELEFYLSHAGTEGNSEPVALAFRAGEGGAAVMYSEAITAFAGDSPGGAWTLWVRDSSPGNQGKIIDASLRASHIDSGLVTEVSDTGGVPVAFKLQAPVEPSATILPEDKPVPTAVPESEEGGSVTGWFSILNETFESTFPSANWSLSDQSSDGCEFLWDDDDYRAQSGAWAAWPANGGANALDPAASYYPPNMRSWMIYGPFSLSNATDAILSFDLWRQLENTVDYVFAGASSDGVNFTGLSYSGTASWTSITLNLSSYAGDSSVWIGFLFVSDASVQMEGAWIDDVVVERYSGVRDCTNGLSAENYLSTEALYAAYSAAHQNAQADHPIAQPEEYQISMISRQFTPPVGLDAALEPAKLAAEGQKQHVLVQLYTTPSDAEREELRQAGMQLLHYIPDRAWIASVELSKLDALSAHPLVRWMGAFPVTDRVSPMLNDPAVRSLIESRADDQIALMVEFAADMEFGGALDIVRGLGAQVLSEVRTINAMLIVLPIEHLAALYETDSVIWVEPPLPSFDPLNDCVRQNMGVDTLQQDPYYLTGAGVDLLVYDAGTIATTHSGFAGRLVVGDASGLSDHATHVAGTAAGSGVGSPSGRDLMGMAPGARIVSYGYEGFAEGWLYTYPGDIEHDWREARDTYGADLGTASIGTNVAANDFPCSWEGNYGEVSQLLDGIVRGSLGEPYIATWAVGNERGNGRCGTAYGTVAPPANAKNPIHVGATYSDGDVMTDFSSWGPSDDGRIKPTISAPGCEYLGEGYVNSTIPANTYGGMCGTSMATPAVAGIAALMLQQYRAIYDPTGEPLPSTVKALLIQTAVDKGNPGPDYQYGYGRVDAVGALGGVINGDFKEDGFTQTGEYHDYFFTVAGSLPVLKVSLAWDDAPATPSAQRQLVNDLDLVVIGPNQQSYYPFILNPAYPGNPATTGEDHLNNQEQVIIPNPASGTWIIRVRARALPVTPQSYSIVFSGASTAPVSKHLPCVTLTKVSNPAGGGVINASPAPNCNSGTQYNYGTVVTLTAVPNPGYGFVRWSGGASGTTNPTTVTMTANRSVTANFSTTPAAFGKTAPSNGATNQPLSLTLRWQATSPVTHYTVCYAANSYTCSTWQNVGTNTSLTISGLLPNTRYNWQVRAYNGEWMVSANGGTWWSFTTLSGVSWSNPMARWE